MPVATTCSCSLLLLLLVLHLLLCPHATKPEYDHALSDPTVRTRIHALKKRIFAPTVYVLRERGPNRGQGNRRGTPRRRGAGPWRVPLSPHGCKCTVISQSIRRR
ncbi:hypothetical protein BD779DRAFT_437143 [Infundibulicybe gibba]|nr:hypothetical protein BD779DRAFT_437143 [Infundibulicybe gibba]